MGMTIILSSRALRNWTMSVALAAGTLSCPTISLAQSSKQADSGEIELAKAHHEQGLSFFDQGQFDLALTEFKNAYALIPNYRLLLNIALTQEQLGNLRSAYKSLEQFLSEGSEKLSEEEAANVMNQLKELRGRLGSVQITLESDAKEVSLDGDALDPKTLNQPLLVNPGRHQLVILSRDGRNQSRGFSVEEGETKTIDLLGESAATSPSSPKMVEVGSKSSEPTDTGVVSGQPTFPWWAWTATGALGAGAAVTGIMALNTRQQEKDLEMSGGSSDERIELRQRTENTALASDILLGLSILSAGASVYFTIEWSDKSAQFKRTAQIQPTTNGILVRGTF